MFQRMRWLKGAGWRFWGAESAVCMVADDGNGRRVFVASFRLLAFITGMDRDSRCCTVRRCGVSGFSLRERYTFLGGGGSKS